MSDQQIEKSNSGKNSVVESTNNKIYQEPFYSRFKFTGPLYGTAKFSDNSNNQLGSQGLYCNKTGDEHPLSDAETAEIIREIAEVGTKNLSLPSSFIQAHINIFSGEISLGQLDSPLTAKCNDTIRENGR